MSVSININGVRYVPESTIKALAERVMELEKQNAYLKTKVKPSVLTERAERLLKDIHRAEIECIPGPIRGQLIQIGKQTEDLLMLSQLRCEPVFSESESPAAGMAERDAAVRERPYETVEKLGFALGRAGVIPMAEHTTSIRGFVWYGKEMEPREMSTIFEGLAIVWLTKHGWTLAYSHVHKDTPWRFWGKGRGGGTLPWSRTVSEACIDALNRESRR